MAGGRAINLDLEVKNADSEKEQQQQFIEILQTLPGYKKYQTQFKALFKQYNEADIFFDSQSEDDLSYVFGRIVPSLKKTDAEGAYVILKFLYLYLSAETANEREVKTEEEIRKEKYKRKIAIKLLDYCPITSEPFFQEDFKNSENIFIDNNEKVYRDKRKNLVFEDAKYQFKKYNAAKKTDVYSDYLDPFTGLERQPITLFGNFNEVIVSRYFEAYQVISQGIGHLKTVLIDILLKKQYSDRFHDVLKNFSPFYILENKENIIEFLENPEKMKVYSEVQQHLHGSIKAQMLTVLREYADNNLTENNEHKHVGKGIWVFPSRKIWDTRGMAYDQLVGAINKSSSSWAQFNTLCQDQAFRRNAGYTNQSRGFVTKILNTDGNRGTLWNRIRALKDIIKKQNTFFEKFKDDNLLRDVLSNDIYFSALTHKELKPIFRHCNQALFFELIEKQLKADWQLHIKIPNIHPRLNEILAAGKTAEEIEQVNVQRYQLGIGSIVPAGYQSQNLSKNTQILSPEELFQLEESDISLVMLNSI